MDDPPAPRDPADSSEALPWDPFRAAVLGLASDLDASDRREALADGLFRLLEDAKGLPHVSEAGQALLAAPDLAWRAYACSLLAEELAEA